MLLNYGLNNALVFKFNSNQLKFKHDCYFILYGLVINDPNAQNTTDLFKESST